MVFNATKVVQAERNGKKKMLFLAIVFGLHYLCTQY